MQTREPHDCWFAILDPGFVLLKSALKVNHPVAKRFESCRSKLAPHGRQLAIVKRACELIELVGHANLTSKRLYKKNVSKQRQTK